MASKRKAIKSAIVSQLGNISVANGYNTDVGEIVDKDTDIRGVNAFPAIQVTYGREDKAQNELHRKRGMIEFDIKVICKKPDADDACDDLAADIENNLETKVGNLHLGLGYVDEVELLEIDARGNSDEIDRSVRIWYLLVRVTYRHARAAA
ncbi:MAG: hypothetical protein R3344_07120 [Acidobacteriota bacterium]|nr:hypothetical protein [Acidobacteriota bacterium]